MSLFHEPERGITMIKITDEMKDRVNKAFDDKKYCVWATTSSDGHPDLSFRGSTFVFDDEHIAFWDRSLGTSSTNLENNPYVCMLYYDAAARTGWRFYGTAAVYKEGDLRQQIMKGVVKGELDKDPDRKGYGVLVRVDKIRGYSGFNVVQEREKEG
jgi:predicted pyridoxine 5'-phosphate oxidase superfamily flavin-nucleotide-binding protein